MAVRRISGFRGRRKQEVSHRAMLDPDGPSKKATSDIGHPGDCSHLAHGLQASPARLLRSGEKLLAERRAIHLGTAQVHSVDLPGVRDALERIGVEHDEVRFLGGRDRSLPASLAEPADLGSPPKRQDPARDR